MPLDVQAEDVLAEDVSAEDVSAKDVPGEDVQTAWARLLIVSLAEAGVRHLVISPGSRSTPLVLAATREPLLECFDVVDERAAAYFALGLARITGQPAVLLCTSGTAGANYLPAVVEAGMAHVPLVVLTADRPVELTHCGANQTIDQLHLFGHHARRFFDLGCAESTPQALRGLRRIVAQAVFTSRWPEPGAVHLNARLRKPLEPPTGTGPRGDGCSSAVDSLLARPRPRPVAPQALPAAAELDDLAQRMKRSVRGILVYGPAPANWGALNEQVAALASRAGLVVFADPASQLRFRAGNGGAVFIDSLDALLHTSSFRQGFKPDLIVQLGRVPTSGAWQRQLTQLAGVEHQVLLPHGWHDAASTATALLFCDLEAALDGLLKRFPQEPATTTPWLAHCRAADTLAWSLAEDELAGAQGLTEGAVAQVVVAHLPAEGLLVVGNSLPIRQVDTWCQRQEPLVVTSQRGASGIDGVVAGAAGAARAHGGPAALLIGDVSFLHDLSGLSTVRLMASPLALVVVQNRGGRIFEQLPVVHHPAVPAPALNHWLTPHEDDFAGAAALYRLPFLRVESIGALAEALAEALGRPGATVIEAVVPPHGAAEQNQQYWRRLERLLAEKLPS